MEFEEIKSVETFAKEYLQKNGIKYTEPEELLGDIHFLYEGRSFLFSIDKQDTKYLRLCLPGIYKIDNDRIKVLEELVKLTTERKLLKATLVRDHVWLSVESLIDENSNIDFFEDTIERFLNILFSGRREFYERMGY